MMHDPETRFTPPTLDALNNPTFLREGQVWDCFPQVDARGARVVYDAYVNYEIVARDTPGKWIALVILRGIQRRAVITEDMILKSPRRAYRGTWERAPTLQKPERIEARQMWAQLDSDAGGMEVVARAPDVFGKPVWTVRAPNRDMAVPELQFYGPDWVYVGEQTDAAVKGEV